MSKRILWVLLDNSIKPAPSGAGFILVRITIVRSPDLLRRSGLLARRHCERRPAELAEAKQSLVTIYSLPNHLDLSLY